MSRLPLRIIRSAIPLILSLILAAPAAAEARGNPRNSWLDALTREVASWAAAWWWGSPDRFSRHATRSDDCFGTQIDPNGNCPSH
jgi:hypothetical protein